jgi:thymidylate kinase
MTFMEDADPVEEPKAPVKVENFNIPHENAMASYGKTKKQLNLIEQEKILEMQIKLDKKFDDLYKKEFENLKERDVE